LSSQRTQHLPVIVTFNLKAAYSGEAKGALEIAEELAVTKGGCGYVS
jgi:hypothetical protein